MNENKNDKKSKLELNELMMVIVNRDWNRSYSASVKTHDSAAVGNALSAKCDLKKESIIGVAGSKNQLSTNMDELATIVEDRISKETPLGTPVIAGMKFILN